MRLDIPVENEENAVIDETEDIFSSTNNDSKQVRMQCVDDTLCVLGDGLPVFKLLNVPSHSIAVYSKGMFRIAVQMVFL